MGFGTYMKTPIAIVFRKCPTPQFLNPLDHRAHALVMAGTSLRTASLHTEALFRRIQPSYRPRFPNADRYESGYDNDKPRFGWGARYSHSHGYDPSSDSSSRRDVMAERMFEPSESWKHDHV